VLSSKWNRENISGARVYFQEMLPLKSRVEQTLLTKIISKEELLRPIYNPFVLTSLRPPRASDRIEEPLDAPGVSDAVRKWDVLKPGLIRMALPRSPPEANCRCAFVLQLLSSRPARASAEQAAHAELWRLTFDETAKDLAELGAPGGLAYELKFNKYGLRISFLGLSQTIPSYVRRLTQILAKHQQNLLKSQKTLSQSIVSSALADANRARSLSPARKYIIVNTLQKSTSYDVALEGIAFLQSCTSAVCFSEGDLTLNETESLLKNVQTILKDSIGAISIKDEQNISTIPSVEDLIETPNWKPRNASPCCIPGVSLMSDVCGRIPR
jgi:insulysin